MDPTSYWWQLAISILLAAMYWLGNRAVKRVDEHHADIETLKRTAITKADLKEQSESLKEAIEKTGKDIIARVGAVDAKADRANSRIDQINNDELVKLRGIVDRGHLA